MIYVYAITDAGRSPTADTRGLADASVTMATAGRVAAAYSEHTPQRFPADAERLWRHEAVVEALLRNDGGAAADVAVLPVRFGVTFEDVQGLDEALSRHAAALAAGLQRVRGCVEMSVRVTQRAEERATQPPAEPSAAESGRAYMLARLVDEQRRRATESDAQRVADALEAALGRLSRAAARRPAPAPRGVLTVAHLVARDQVDPFVARVREVAASMPELRLTCTGPWPPYHFAPALDVPEVAHA